MLHEVQLFIAAVHKKVHITLIYVPLCRLCPFCDKKMQFGRRFGKIDFILLIYVHRQHIAADISPRDVSQRARIHRTKQSARRCHVTVHFFPLYAASAAVRGHHFLRAFRSGSCCCKSPSSYIRFPCGCMQLSRLFFCGSSPFFNAFAASFPHFQNHLLCGSPPF